MSEDEDMAVKKKSSGCGCGTVLVVMLLMGVVGYVMFSDSPEMKELRSEIPELESLASSVKQTVADVTDEQTHFLRADNPYWGPFYITEQQWRSLSTKDKMHIGGWEAAWRAVETMSANRSANACTPRRITQSEFERACRVVLKQPHSNYPYAAAMQAVGYAQVRECGGGGWLPNYNSRLVDPTPIQTWR